MRFTMEDYLRNISNTPMLLEQPERQYQLTDGQEEVHQYRDKIFRLILDKEKEALLVIERLLKNEKIDNLKEGSIEKYNRKFTTKTLKYSSKLRKRVPGLAEKYLKKLNKEEGDESMFDKLLDEYGQKLARQAEEKRIAKVIFEMLKEKFDEKAIMKVTGVSKEELDNLKLQAQ